MVQGCLPLPPWGPNGVAGERGWAPGRVGGEDTTLPGDAISRMSGKQSPFLLGFCSMASVAISAGVALPEAQVLRMGPGLEEGAAMCICLQPWRWCGWWWVRVLHPGSPPLRPLPCSAFSQSGVGGLLKLSPSEARTGGSGPLGYPQASGSFLCLSPRGAVKTCPLSLHSPGTFSPSPLLSSLM